MIVCLIDVNFIVSETCASEYDVSLAEGTSKQFQPGDNCNTLFFVPFPLFAPDSTDNIRRIVLIEI